MRSDSDVELLRRWTAGDTPAGHRLFSRYSAMVCAFFRNNGSPDAEDLVQQTLLGCLEGASRFRQESSFSTFVIAIARNQLRAHRRQLVRARRSDPIHALEETPAWHESPERGWQECVLARAVAELPLDLQAVIDDFYWRGLGQSAIADLRGVPVGTVASRMRRAKDKLRTFMSSGDILSPNKSYSAE